VKKKFIVACQQGQLGAELVVLDLTEARTVRLWE
jgi:hypothetical protein